MILICVAERIGCSSLRGAGGELGTNKNFDLWLQLVCTKLKLKHVIIAGHVLRATATKYPMFSTGFVVHLHTRESILSFWNPSDLWALHMCDKSFGNPKLLGELLLCFLCDFANEFGLHLALYLTQKKMVILMHRRVIFLVK